LLSFKNENVRSFSEKLFILVCELDIIAANDFGFVCTNPAHIKTGINIRDDVKKTAKNKLCFML